MECDALRDSGGFSRAFQCLAGFGVALLASQRERLIERRLRRRNCRKQNQNDNRANRTNMIARALAPTFAGITLFLGKGFPRTR